MISSNSFGVWYERHLFKMAAALCGKGDCHISGRGDQKALCEGAAPAIAPVPPRFSGMRAGDGRNRALFDHDVFDALDRTSPDAIRLWARLERHHGGMARSSKWP
jgi:hypothetical protein